MRKLLFLLAFAASCAAVEATSVDPADETSGTADGERAKVKLGATLAAASGAVSFRVYSEHATRIEVWLYTQPFGAAEVGRYVLSPDTKTHMWSTTIARSKLAAGTLYYGLRAWGPNWPYDPAWTPGTAVGFLADVDDQENRFNPNKLLLDPYALEVSHDPVTPDHQNADDYHSGPGTRTLDSGPVAPKGIVLAGPSGDVGTRPTRPLRDEIIYEVHLRGLTMNDPSVPAELRGTYAGAATKAAYLRDLGVTAIELLPVQELQNDANDVHADTKDDDYWGYANYAYFAPDRRYAADRSPGGPTREVQAMVKAFHDQGLKVYIDVVYNHTGEGNVLDLAGDVALIFSWRGLDNAVYYEQSGPKHYYDNNGVGPNFATARTPVRNEIIDSLRYWNQILGVDGFRFDIAPVLGNSCAAGCFQFDKLDPANALNRAVQELPGRPDDGGAGVDLIAEPWGLGNGTYQLGNFPWGWAEWNGTFRDTLRAHQNQLGITPVAPAALTRRLAGSSDLFQDDGRKPWHSINFLVAHDGMTLKDLYSCNAKSNAQPWPYGPSDGGTDTNLSWDQGGDPAAQRQAARTGMALLALSAGVPMLTGGDEMLRSQRCNNNVYNLDSVGSWLDWSDADRNAAFLGFTRKLLAFRQAHPALRPAAWLTGSDHNGNGLKDITWLRDDGTEAGGDYLDDPSRRFLAWRLDGTEVGDPAASIYVAYNGWSGWVTATLPANLPGKQWTRVSDTAGWMEAQDNFVEDGTVLGGATYGLAPRSLLILVER